MKSTKDIKKITQLIDNYGSLLSPCKKKYIENYYFQNYSLGDIAETFKISRAAVHDSVQDAIAELHALENNLKFIHMQEQRIKFYEKNIKDKQLLLKLLELEYGKKTTC